MKNGTERRWLRRWALVAVIIGLGYGSSGCQGCGALGGTDAGTDAKDAGADAKDAKKDQAAEAPSADAAQDTAGADTAQDTASADAAQDTASSDAAQDTASTDTAKDTATTDAAGDVTVVGTFGCFARSGDGADFFANGAAAVVVTDSPWRTPCGVAWISTNSHGYAPEMVPVTETITKTFIVDSLISDRATFTISVEVDDAAEIVLNGKVIASCTPPEGNAGLCQQSCMVFTLAKTDFKPAGEPNQLQIKMINLQSGNAGGGNFGWSGISYEICATGE